MTIPNFNQFLLAMDRIAKGEPEKVRPKIQHLSLSIQPYYKDCKEIKVCCWSEDEPYWYTEVITDEADMSELACFMRRAYRDLEKNVYKKERVKPKLWRIK